MVCRAAPIFLLTHKSRMDESFIYYEHVRKILRKFPENMDKKVSAQQMSFGKVKLQIRLEYSDKISSFSLDPVQVLKCTGVPAHFNFQ